MFFRTGLVVPDLPPAAPRQVLTDRNPFPVSALGAQSGGAAAAGSAAVLLGPSSVVISQQQAHVCPLSALAQSSLKLLFWVGLKTSRSFSVQWLVGGGTEVPPALCVSPKARGGCWRLSNQSTSPTSVPLELVPCALLRCAGTQVWGWGLYSPGDGGERLFGSYIIVFTFVVQF